MTETERVDRAELAVGTLQTALRHYIVRLRARADEKRGTFHLHSEQSIRAMRTCADELEALLPALEPTP